VDEQDEVHQSPVQSPDAQVAFVEHELPTCPSQSLAAAQTP